MKKFRHLSVGDYVYGIINREYTPILIVNTPDTIDERCNIYYRVNLPEEGLNGLLMAIPPKYQNDVFWGVFTTDDTEYGKMRIMARDFSNYNKIYRNNDA